MKYEITNYRTGEKLCNLDALNYPDLETTVLAHFKAESVVFDRYDPLPGVVNVKIIKAEGSFYEKLMVGERDLKKELKNCLMDNLPFNTDDVIDVKRAGGNVINFTIVRLKDGRQFSNAWVEIDKLI